MAAGFAVAQSAAQAQTAVQSFNVTATVQKSCIVSTNDLGFGTYIPTDSDKLASTTLTVTCTNQTPYNVQLNDGLNGTVANRKMKGGAGADTLNYNLYVDRRGIRTP
jgi:spore coat protein U-like protein